MRRSDVRRAVVFGSAALLLLGPTAAIAQADPTSSDSGVSDQAAHLPVELTEALQHDLNLSPSQYLERSELAQHLNEFAGIARIQYPDAFAGSWLDQNGKGTVGLAESPNKAAARVAVEKAGFQVKDVAKSESTLKSEQSSFDTWVSQQPPAIANLIRGVALDIVNNTLAVRVDNVAQGLQLPQFIDPAHVFKAPALADAEPAAKPVAAATNVAATDAVLGGDQYSSTSGDVSLRCSLGFNGTDGSGHVVNISAGHCDPNLPAAGGPNASPVFAPAPLGAAGERIGTFQKTSLGNHDYSIIRATDQARGRFENNLVRVPNALPVAINGTADPVVGAPVCKSGSRTGFSCGTIQSVNETVQVGERQLNNSFSANICALPGDSGGAVITGTRALGISSASTVADDPICEVANIRGFFTGEAPTLVAMPINVVLNENPGLRVRTS